MIVQFHNRSAINSSMFLLLVLSIGCHAETKSAEESQKLSSTANGRLVIDDETQQRLGIEMTPVRRQTIQHTVARIGWLEPPPSSETVIRAPVAGFVTGSDETQWPNLGQNVAAKEPLATINVFLSPQEIAQQVQAKEETDIQIQQSLVSMKLAEEQLKRVKTAPDAVAGVRLNDLQELFERSKAAYQEAQEKLPFLIQEPYDADVLMKPVKVDVPRAGRVIQIHVSPRQFVQAGDSLWTVADWSTLWLRVPVFEGEYDRITREANVSVQSRHRREPVLASPLVIPTTTKTALRTIDFYYSVPNPEWQFRVGQALTVQLPLGEQRSALLVPMSAVLYDVQGQTFVYAREEEATVFHRQRVELGPRQSNDVVVIRGLDDDDFVVSVGAEVLYAEEFKDGLAVEDND